ncbi:multicopper oxidase domain-containing protein [Geodermatophilus sabuli]|uniref:Multicopper oxidase domain-containing protein n=1 Tax=Geodermatophilus sabuli TaxID=1564158 RepID=A0A7K3W4Z0_9ACTN|nr:multicopper oxidase domain-containing protein [Geodermatophilus sabuli]NEK59965.1 multicopper oxidase domain-containing protein [Geodermatophilus sabuli]
MDTPSLNRRDALKVGLAGTAAMALPLQAVLKAKAASELPDSKMPKPFTQAFKAPPVLQPVARDDIADDVFGYVPDDYVPTAENSHFPGQPIRGSQYVGTDYYHLTETNVQVQIVPGVWTKMWCYAGGKGDSLARSIPGPTIRSYLQKDPATGKKMPRRTVMQVVNGLPKKHPTMDYVPWTSLHLHGSPSKPQFDGYAGDLTNPGEWKNYEYPNSCTPRTLWYHDHGVHHTAQNVYMGLAAQYHVVDRELEQALEIPQYDPSLPSYAPGQYEVPLILGDVILTADGQLLFDDSGEDGLYGDIILVNGVPWPNMKVEPRKYRFRMLNGCLARGFQLRLSNGAPFKVIATDGGFMQFAQEVTTFRIGMAERYEFIIDFAAFKGQKVQLLNDGVANAVDYDHTGKVMQFEVGTKVTSTKNNKAPTVLGAPHPVMTLKAAERSAVRKMKLHRSNGMWKIDDQTWDDVVRSGYTRLFANPARDAVEIWEVENNGGGWFHPLHIHLIDFKVLGRGEAGQTPPLPEEKGPKDVVYIAEGETVRLLMKFEHEDGRYMIHCHNLSHEDHDMMLQYQVGHHDIDCDAINSCPPKALPAPDLVAKTAAVAEPAPPATAPEADSTGGSTTTGSTPTTPDSTTTDSTTTGSTTTGSTPTTPDSATTGSTTTGTTATEPAPTGSGQ